MDGRQLDAKQAADEKSPNKNSPLALVVMLKELT